MTMKKKFFAYLTMKKKKDFMFLFIFFFLVQALSRVLKGMSILFYLSNQLNLINSSLHCISISGSGSWSWSWSWSWSSGT
ncbi:hypothetical protein BD770DRAFT_398308, partial [Pilaira anomala]